MAFSHNIEAHLNREARQNGLCFTTGTNVVRQTVGSQHETKYLRLNLNRYYYVVPNTLPTARSVQTCAVFATVELKSASIFLALRPLSSLGIPSDDWLLAQNRASDFDYDYEVLNTRWQPKSTWIIVVVLCWLAHRYCFGKRHRDCDSTVTERRRCGSSSVESMRLLNLVKLFRLLFVCMIKGEIPFKLVRATTYTILLLTSLFQYGAYCLAFY